MMTRQEYVKIGEWLSPDGDIEDVFSNNDGTEKCPKCDTKITLKEFKGDVQKFIDALNVVFGFRFKHPEDLRDKIQSQCKICRRSKD